MTDPFEFPARSKRNPHPGAHMVVVYEDFSSALWACECVRERLGALVSGGAVAAWSFSALLDAESRRRATGSLENAEVLVLAVSAIARSLPAPVSHWLAHALAERAGTPCTVWALPAAFPEHLPKAMPRLRWLRTLVEDSGATFRRLKPHRRGGGSSFALHPFRVRHGAGTNTRT
jgi:hypothetical protein